MELRARRVIGLLLAAGTAVAAAPAGAVAHPPGTQCGPASYQLSQAMSGRISGCVRLGPVPAGPHVLAVQQLLVPGATPGSPPPEPAVTMTQSPASGRPGTVVTITGRLTRPIHPRSSYPNLCWDSCQNGLSDGDTSVRWTSARAFRTRIVVPDAPWVEQHPDRVARLADGGYPIGVDCIRLAGDCAAVTEGSATFRLRGAHEPSWCRTEAACARLAVSPDTAMPSDVVRVTGDVPLVSLAGAGQGSLAPAILRDRRHAPAVAFATRNGVTTASFGRAAVHVHAPPSYAGLPAVAPIAETTDGPTPITAVPADPSTVAWCAGTTIAISSPAGATRIPTATVGPVLRRMGVKVIGSSPDCVSVAPVDDAAGAPVGLAAAFTVALAPGAPPFYDAAVVTDDGGQTWAPLAIPHGSIVAGFGGFRYTGGELEAVFATSRPQRPDPALDTTRPLAEAVDGDGVHWHGAPLSCPEAGPCVTLGPYLPGNCAMNGAFQPVARSSDAGRSWSQLGFPYEVQACGEAEVVATSARSALLVDSTSPFPVLRSGDDGITWHDVGLPRRPGHGGITVLPDGSLLMAGGLGYSGAWELLRRGARSWCRLRAPDRAQQRANQLTPLTVIGDQLWWLTGTPQTSTPPAAHQFALSALAC